MRKVVFYLLASLVFFAVSCARNTAPNYRDGRIFARIDSPARLCEMGCLRITAEVEGYEPVVTAIFDFDNPRAQTEWKEKYEGLQRDKTLNWNDVQGELIDLTGRLIEGGRETRVTVWQPFAHSQSASIPSFRVDGNAIVSVYYATFAQQPQGPFQLRIKRIQ